MTSYAKAPGAPAIILSYDEEDDGVTAEVLVHVRIKVLAEGGRSAGDIELPDYVAMNPYANTIYGRTIQPNGSIVPFTGKLKEMSGKERSAHNVMALPDVEVGSILEYGYHLVGADYFGYSYLYRNYAPWWQVQQTYHVCSGHFELRTGDIDRASVRWVSNLPAGSQVQQIKNRVELDVSDVPPLPNEDFTPPISSLSYRVRFFYSTGDSSEYWSLTGGPVDADWKNFYNPTKSLTEAVNQMIGPADTDAQKLRKIYDAVMALENTELTRARSGREDKQEGFKEAKKSEDIWRRRRGNSQELALLFVALARAAGFEAYPMAVTSRDSAIFNPEVLSWTQLDSTIAVIDLKGQTLFLDPGCRGCPYGHLAWWHSNVRGISFEGKRLVFRETPSEPASANRTLRTADLKVDEQGAVTGTVKITYYGTATVPMRRLFLRQDLEAVQAGFAKSLQEDLPSGVQMKLLKLSLPDDYSSEMVADFSVSGTLGTAAGKRLLVPAFLLASTAKPLFAPANRTLPISFAEAYAVKDVVRIEFPKTMAIESMPGSKTLNMAKDLLLTINASKSGDVVTFQSLFILNRLDYTVQEYPELHKYFAQVAGDNQDQLVLNAVRP